jgi:hypothetical protein
LRTARPRPSARMDPCVGEWEDVSTKRGEGGRGCHNKIVGLGAKTFQPQAPSRGALPVSTIRATRRLQETILLGEAKQETVRGGKAPPHEGGQPGRHKEM